ncbi:MAG TPA: TonB-dependent receptor [Polyangiaceae bacterium]|nr:TonB-dependent receptor [Polyangiaceae bacterium]
MSSFRVSWAEQPAAPLEIVVTGTRTPEDQQRSTLKTGLVTREEAERRGASNVAEALAGELGVEVNPNSYGYLGGPAGAQMQGLDAERVLVLEDGERVVGDFGGVVDLASLPLTGVDRIEYVSGPTSSLYGTGALGGVINVITAPPNDGGASARARAEARAPAAYLTQDTAAYRRGALWAALDGSYRHADGIRLFPESPDLALPDRDQAALGLRLGSSEEDHEARLSLRWLHDASNGLQSQWVPNLGNFLVDLPSKTDRIVVRGMDRVNVGGHTTLQGSIATQRFLNEAVTDRRDSPLDETRNRDHALSSAELTATAQATRGMTVVAGVRGERETFAQNLERVVAVDGEPVISRFAEVPHTLLVSGALYAQLGFAPSAAFSVLPGLRLEYHDRFGAVWAPRLAVAWRTKSELTLRAATGRGFRAPSAKEFGFFFDHSYLGYRVIGNEDLKPETSWGVTADVAWVPVALPRIRLRVGGFANWIHNLIGETFIGREQAGVDDFAYVNVGRARTAGVEAASEFTLFPRVRSIVGYHLLHTLNLDSGRPLPSRPAHTVLASLVYQPVDALELMLRERGVSSAYLSDGVRTPPFVMLDARAAYRMLPGLQAYVGVLNALDAKDDPNRPGDQRPVTGRTLLVGVNVEYAAGGV